MISVRVIVYYSDSHKHKNLLSLYKTSLASHEVAVSYLSEGEVFVNWDVEGTPCIVFD